MYRAVLCCLLAIVGVHPVWAYEYPFTDPYVATVFGTPPQDKYSLDLLRPASVRDLNPLHDFRSIRGEELCVHDRPVPDIFWYNDTLQYSVALHRDAAPLLFILAGTGSSHESATCRFLQQVFYYAGFHVVTLSSTTYPNFIVSASSTQVPGFVPQDVEDLYRSMNAIVDSIGRERISAYNLTGYSLGATHAAFLGALDNREKRLGLDRVLLLNPAVSLMTSASILDRLMTDSVQDQSEVSGVVSSLIRELSSAYRMNTEVNFGDDFLFDLQKSMPLSERELKILIGVYFRLSLASMVFASDVCTGAGYIVPRGHRVSEWESLTPYLDASLGVTFDEFTAQYLIPFIQFHHPELSAEEIVAACSMQAIAPYLSRAENVAVMTNADDPILTSADFAFLERTFGSRLRTYPVGGHCGNLVYRDNIAAMLDFFQK